MPAPETDATPVPNMGTTPATAPDPATSPATSPATTSEAGVPDPATASGVAPDAGAAGAAGVAASTSGAAGAAGVAASTSGTAGVAGVAASPGPLARAMETTSRYRAAGEAGDVDAVLATLAPGVVFHSPLTGRVRFEGHEQVRTVFQAALGAMDGYRYTGDTGDEHQRVLVSTARVGGHDLHEIALVRLDGDARITEITMWMRPLPAMTAAMRAIGPRLARATGRPVLAALTSAALAPLVFMTRSGDQTMVPLLARPPRAR